jgi:hypothetical protein
LGRFWHLDYVVQKLHKSGLCTRFPDTGLRLLDGILNDQPWALRELMQCLDAIAKAKTSLQKDRRFQQLVEYARRRGLS